MPEEESLEVTSENRIEDADMTCWGRMVIGQCAFAVLP